MNQTPEIRIHGDAQTTIIDIEGTIGVPEARQFDDPERVSTYDRFREHLAAIAHIRTPLLRVNIRSTGGDVEDALLIHDALAALDARVTTCCYGYVASAATLIAQAASPGEREISANALYLVHRTIASCEGNAAQIGQRVDLLEKTDERLAAVYARRSGRPAEAFRLLMAENDGRGRWLTPDEALEAGLVDRIVGAEPLHAEARERRLPAGSVGWNALFGRLRDGLRACAALLGASLPEPSLAPSPNLLPDPLPHLSPTTSPESAVPPLPPLSVSGAPGSSEGEGDAHPAFAAASPVASSPLVPPSPFSSPSADAQRIETMRSGQRSARPTRCRPCEDPSPEGGGAAPNEEAYRRDAQRFASMR